MNQNQKSLKNRYIFVLEDSHSRRTISLEESKYSLGRHSSNSIMINSRQVSRKHATLIRKTNRSTNQDSFWILDGDLDGNKSQNGVFVNGEKCLVHELKDGDLINFGCEVNASYHLVSSCNISQTILDEPSISNNKNFPSYRTLSFEKIGQNPTLVLGDLPIKNHNDEDTFQEQPYLDPLTELPNRVLFNEYVSIALTNANSNQNLVGIILIDIEQFSQINDSLGYTIGDHFLKAISERIKTCLREGDIVARWGGDEFIILLPKVKANNDLEKITLRINNTLQNPFNVDHHTRSLIVNIGSAIYPRDGQETHTLLNYAETQLIANKQSEMIVKIELKAQKVDPISLQLSQIEDRLFKALTEDEIFLYYQPQINLSTGKVESMEAFLRWKHPQRGLINPDQFLPWVEKTDLIIPLTRWILKTACTQNKNWQKRGLSPIIISVNLSLWQFYHPQLLDFVTETLSSQKLDAQWLELEITEPIILKDVSLAHRILNSLQEVGVSLCLDDFGKGYTAVSYLSKMPFNQIKIDRSLIKSLIQKPEDTAMISALIALGKHFNLKVVAEGVETKKQVEILSYLQCNAMQGYQFSHPLPLEEATEFLASYHLQIC